MENNPFAAATGAVRSNARIDLNPSFQVAYQHTLLLGDADRLSVGFQYLYLKTDFDNPTPFAHFKGPDHDYGLALRYEVNRALGSHKNRLVWGVDWTRGAGDSTTSGPVYFGNFLAEPSTGVLQFTRNRRSLTEFFVHDSYNVTPSFTIVAGAQIAYTQRHLIATTPTPPTFFPIFFPNAADKDYFAFNPKLGFLWGPRGKVQIFANVSRSFEAPDEFEFSSGSALGNLDAQRATTLEAGTRGGNANFAWDFATYYSWVRKEIFSVQTPPNSGNFVTFNRDRTRHAGIEAGLHGKVPLEWRSTRGSVNWNLAYAWNRFRFSNDPDFANNSLPIVPKHFGRIDLTYRHPSGFYAGPKFEAASDLFVDLANTLRSPGYGILGATVGFSREGKYRIFLDLRNLEDRHYAASPEYVVNAKGKDSPAFNPGLTRSVFGGVEFRWRP